MKKVKTYCAEAVLFVLLATNITSLSAHQKHPEIKWDEWNVPHIIASNPQDAFYALGWAQMKMHGNSILKLYGQARGEAASYWGKEHLTSDRQKRRLQIPNRAQDWYAAQSKEMKANLNAFVNGMSAYLSNHEDEFSQEMKRILPLRVTDPLAQLQVGYHLGVAGFALQPQAQEWKNAGSNAWAIGPSKSKSGNSMLLMQPHPPWIDNYLFFESHTILPDNNSYGIYMLGAPVMAMGFNESLGWALTFSQVDAMDLYGLEVGEKGYMFDGRWEKFEEHQEIISIRGEQGIQYDTLIAKKSLHGWVIEEKAGKALALRLGGLEKPHFVQQFFDMAKARNLEQFETAVSSLQMPLQNIVYADKNGSIFYLFNGEVPKRQNDNMAHWQRILDGAKKENATTEYLSYAELPKFSNPPSGFISNTNNPPWSTTIPSVLSPDNFPKYLTPNFLDFRTQRALRMLKEKETISFEDLNEMIFSTHSELADHSLDALIQYAKGHTDSLMTEAAALLAGWSKSFDADSKGAIVFAKWALSFSGKMFEDSWDFQNILDGPKQLSEAAKAHLFNTVKELKAQYGQIDMAWGDVYKLQFGGKIMPSSVGLNETGSFAAGFYVPMSEKEFMLMGGPSFSAIIEFGEKVKAKGLLSYGNATQEKFIGPGNQLEYLSKKQLRDILFYQDDLLRAKTKSEILDK